MSGVHMRTEKSIRNIVYGEVNVILTVLLSIVTRTALVRILGLSAVSLNGLFTEVISVLSLAELGVGSAITYNLYKPLSEQDEQKLTQLQCGEYCPGLRQRHVTGAGESHRANLPQRHQQLLRRHRSPVAVPVSTGTTARRT